MTSKDQHPIATGAFVIDHGDSLSMINIPRVSGPVRLENVYEDEEDLADGFAIQRSRGVIKELVIRIPVEREKDGSIFNARHLRSSDD